MKHARIVLGLAILGGSALSVDAQMPAHSSAGLHETVTPLFHLELPNAPGKALFAVEVLFPPGAAAAPHTHPKSAFVYAYVVSGEIVSAVDDQQPRVYRAGESWHELPGAHHPVTRNASRTSPAKLLAIFVAERGERQLVFPDSNGAK